SALSRAAREVWCSMDWVRAGSAVLGRLRVGTGLPRGGIASPPARHFRGREITLLPDQSPAEELATLAHELAHTSRWRYGAPRGASFRARTRVPSETEAEGRIRSPSGHRRSALPASG